MEFEKQLKYKTILAVMIILIGLSTIYFVIGIKNQKRYRDWNIQKDNDIISLEVNNVLNSTYSIYKEKVNYFVLNPQIKESFSKKDIEKLYKKAFPYYSILKTEFPYHFIINLYDKSSTPFLKMNKGPNDYTDNYQQKEYVQKTNKHKKRISGFEFQKSKLFYKIVEPIFYNKKYIGCIEFGIREDEIVDNISNKHDIELAAYFSKEKMPNKLKDKFADFTFKGDLIRSYSKTSVFSSMTNKQGFDKIQKYKGKYYYFGNIANSNELINKGFKGIYFLKDISQLQNEYQLFVLKSLIIMFLILLAVFLILFYSFNAVTEKIFNLKASLEKRLSEQTKDIIDTNSELKQIFNTTSNSLRLIDNNFNIIRVNKAFSILSGVRKEYAEQRKCYEVFPGPYCHTSECPLTQIKEGKERVEHDIKKVSKEGKVIPGISTSALFKNNNDEPIGIIEDFKDITERITAENALKETEKMFSEYMNNLPLGVFIKDEYGKMEYLNKFMDNKFSKKVINNKTPHEIFPVQYANRVINEDNRVLEGELLVVEEKVPDKNGEMFTYLTHKFRFRGLGQNWKIGGVSLDITQNRKIEYKLKVLSNAIQHSPACVVITKLNVEIEFVNPSFTKTTGYEDNEVIGKNISILRNEEFSKDIFTDILESVKKDIDWQGEFHNQKKNGEFYWELASISSVKNTRGRTTNFVIISEDITERKLHEKELIEAKEKAE
ncbi:MAG: PAS domain S-box protein [Bacteroidales bacterium]|jgi:PAS domain S-box-containing protein|nr:PAS domain S-box protein [Bacteroidales bacterium]